MKTIKAIGFTLAALAVSVVDMCLFTAHGLGLTNFNPYSDEV